MDSEKKRLMYIQGEDFNFLTYNTVILLHTLECTNEKRFLKDYRKVSFLMDFVSNPYFATLIVKNSLSDSDKKELTRIYSNGILRLKEINKLFYALDNRKIISLERKTNSDVLNVTLNESFLPTHFIDKNLFQVEIENALIIKNNIQRLSSITLDTLKQKLFIEKGVKAWQLF